MKKSICILMLCAALLNLAACGAKETPNTQPTQTTAAPETVPTTLPETTAPAETEPEPTEPEPRSADFYYGTWAVKGIKIKDEYMLLADAVEKGIAKENLSEARMIFQETGDIMIDTTDRQNIGKWSAADNGVSIEGTVCPCEGDQIILLVNKTQNISCVFEKISSSQEFPEPPEETEPETTAPADGIRPEFREAMDAYEAFYEEYFAFMEDYMKNPTNLSLLTKYAGMVSRMQEIDSKFKAWNQSEMSAEELKYYIDLNARIQKRLLDLL